MSWYSRSKAEPNRKQRVVQIIGAVARTRCTSNVLLDGRFTLGVGSGEALNEHATTSQWPNIDVRRLDMLEKAVAFIRQLWSGITSHITASTTALKTPALTPAPSSHHRCQPDPEMLRRFRTNGGLRKLDTRSAGQRRGRRIRRRFV
jgi:alkanesulfonate monooxygenase SsuD/methylene tetrahydromethanopterin reductase-like flavin-dependent oxidoreductase (luciferase family)